MVVIQFGISHTTIRKMTIEFSSELNKKNEENAFKSGFIHQRVDLLTRHI